MADDEKELLVRRNVPQSDLDFNLMTTDPQWGQDSGVHPTLRNRLKAMQTNGEPTRESMWNLLNFYTRDLRLANLSKWDELPYVKYYLDLAGDYLQSDMVRPFLICLSRAATVLELSQSKGGFLRRRMNTFTQEQFKMEVEPKRKNLFGQQSKEGGG